MLIYRIAQKMLSIGHSPEQDANVRITNLYVLLAVPLLLLNASIQTVDYQIQNPLFFVYVASIISANCLILWFNYQHYYRLAQYWMFAVFISDICISSSYWFGLDSLIIFHLVILYPLSILVWQQDKVAQSVILGMASLAFLLTFIWDPLAQYPASFSQHRSALAMVFIDCAIVLSIISHLFSRKTQRVHHHLSQLAKHDPLTGVLNRRELERLCQTDALKHSRSLALALFDLDNFKQINEQFGHHGGDDALCYVVKQIQHCLPEHALLTRLGGDEFCILLANCSTEQLISLAQNCIHQLNTHPWQRDGHSQALNLSMGITLETQRKDLTRMLQDADDAMYSAKRAGRNQYVAAWKMPISVKDSA